MTTPCFRSRDLEEHGGTYKRCIYKAAASGDWVTASSYDQIYPNWEATPLTMDGDTALHIAVSMEKTSFVAKLVERTRQQDTEICRRDGNTAFCIAAISGNMKIAKILFGKNPRLVWIRGQKESLPIQLASLAGQHDMVTFLIEKTQQDMHINLPFQDIVNLFFSTLTSNMYTAAICLLKKNPKLASIENEKGLTALQVLAQSPFDKHAPGYGDLIKSLLNGIEEEEDELQQRIKTSRAMFDGAKSGNVVILKSIFDSNPNLFMEVNSEGQSILHIAILYRQGNVFRLILSKGAVYKNVLMQHVDVQGNNVFHLAGKLAAEGRFGSPIFQTLMHNEELWFEEVGKIVPPALTTMENGEGLTPKELFYKEHKRPSEKAIAELNGIANNFLVVATLLITLGITAGLTIRTNNISGKTPLFKQEIWYMIFILSAGLGVSLCAISMLLFTSIIVPSTWRPKGGYVNSRLTRMKFGCLLISSSVGSLGIFTVMSGLILIYNFFPDWIFYVITAFAGVPVVLYFVFFYHSLNFSLRLILTFCQEWAATLLSLAGINYNRDPFYLE